MSYTMLPPRSTATATATATPTSHAPRSFYKCSFCRERKRKCLPVDRSWPAQKCEPCRRGGQPCGPNVLHDRLPPSSQPLPSYTPTYTPESDLGMLIDDPPLTQPDMLPFTDDTWAVPLFSPSVPPASAPTPRPRVDSRPGISSSPPKPKEAIREWLQNLANLCHAYTCLENRYKVGLDTKPSRRFLNFEDIESGLSAALSSTLSVFEHLCSMILLQISQVSNSADRGEMLQRLASRTSRFLAISMECAPESFGSGHIARQHVKVLERLAKHYEDSGEDAFEADDLRLDVAKLQERYGIAADGAELDEPQIFQRMSERASEAFDAMKLQVHDRHFLNLFAKISPAFPAAHTALCYQRPQAARSLLQSSPDMRSETDILGRQVSHLAAEIGNVSLLGTPSPEARDIYHMTQLAVAANAGDVTLFQTLVDQGFSLESRDIEGRSILCIAAGAGSIDIVRLLLNRKVSPNPYHLSGSRLFSPRYTALHAAAGGGHVDMCKMLLKHGAFARWPFNDCTPSQEAFKHNHQAVGQLLKDAEAAEDRHIEEAERATNINSTPEAVQNTVLSSQVSTTAPPMERSQTQLPQASSIPSGSFTPMSAWPRKRSYAQSEAAGTPVDSNR